MEEELAARLYRRIRTKENRWQVRGAIQRLLSVVHRPENIEADLRVLAAHARDHQTKSELAHFKRALLPASRRVRILSGPSLFLFYPALAGKRLLILGEFHHRKALCPEKGVEVQKWLWDLASSATTCLDLFVETAWPGARDDSPSEAWSIEEAGCPVRAVRAQFEVCRSAKEFCPLALRYHHVDARLVMSNALYDAIIAFYGTGISMQAWLQRHGSIARAYYVGFDRSDEARSYFEAFLDLLLLPNATIKQVIFDEVQATQAVLAKQLQKSRMPSDTLRDVLAAYPVTAVWSVVAAGMDVYFLARLFTTFEQHKMQRGPALCQNPLFGEVRNAIVYCGAAHGRFYRFFLAHVFGAQPTLEVEVGEDQQCIVLPRDFDFFA